MQSAKNSAFSGSAGASVFKPINDTEKLLNNEKKDDVIGLPPSVDNNEDLSVKPNKSCYNSTLLLKILLILVLIVIIVALIIFYFYRREKSEGAKVKMEVETYKKTDEILKNRVQSLDNQLKQMQNENDYQRKQISRLTAERAREQQQRQQQQNMYSEFPTDVENNQNSISLYSNTDSVRPVSNVKSKNKKDEIKMMVNKPRKTVEEMQQEQSAEIERRRQEQDDVIRNELESNTKVRIIDDAQDEGEEKDAIFSAISNSGKLDE